jgi:hypothetical protein
MTVSLRIFSAALAVAAVCAFCLPVHAQSAPRSVPEASVNPKPIPEASLNPKPIAGRKVPVPFPTGADPLEIARSIRLLAPEEMAEPDRLLEANSESSIAERAGYADIAFNQGAWSYRQVACPALPNHLFLRFTRNNGAGDESVFSASIPRNSEGHIRVIPIERRSYSLFSPAPINALTIAAFNRIRSEDQPGPAPDAAAIPTPDSPASWLGTALCYAALAGANPMAAPLNTANGKVYPAAPAPSLEIPSEGGAIIRFTDFSAERNASLRPMAWSLIFNGNGKLLKATHGIASVHGETNLAPSTAKESNIAPSNAAQNATPIPSH